MKNFRLLIVLVFMIAVAQSTLLSSRAYAVDQSTKTLIRGGTYGLIGGTIVGAAVLPLTGSVRGVFIGSSLGLYMGLLMGAYRITHQGDSGGSMRGELNEPSDAFAYKASPRTPMEMPLPVRVSLSMPIARF